MTVWDFYIFLNISQSSLHQTWGQLLLAEKWENCNSILMCTAILMAARTAVDSGYYWAGNKPSRCFEVSQSQASWKQLFKILTCESASRHFQSGDGSVVGAFSVVVKTLCTFVSSSIGYTHVKTLVSWRPQHKTAGLITQFCKIFNWYIFFFN